MKNHTTTVRTLQEKKERGLLLAASYSRLGWDDKAALVRECGTFLGIVEGERGASIVEANFCKDRLCPSCTWRRSLKIFANTSRILDRLDSTHGNKIKFLFLTLTVRNCDLARLGDQIDAMAAGFKRLTNNRAWQRRVLGAMRTLEITINHDSGQAHPHYHLILAVDRNYASKSDSSYWDHAAWTRAWQKAARLDYMPNVSIERVRGRRAGVAEVSKYMAKDTDYLLSGGDAAQAETDRLVRQLAEQLRGRRLISYTGLLAKAQKDLRISDPETGPLTDSVRGDIAAVIKRYHWHAGLSCYMPFKEGF